MLVATERPPELASLPNCERLAGERGLWFAIIKRAAMDFHSPNARRHLGAALFLDSPWYRQMLGDLGIPSDWLPAGVATLEELLAMGDTMSIQKAEKELAKLEKARATMAADLATASGSLETIRGRMGSAIAAGGDARKITREVRDAELYRDGLAAAVAELDSQIEASREEINAAKQAAERERAAALAHDFDALLYKLQGQIDAIAAPTQFHQMADAIRLAVANGGNANRDRAMARARMNAAATIDSKLTDIRHAIAQWKRIAG